MPGVYLKTLVVHTPEHAHLFICKWRTLCEWCVWICPVLIYHVCYKYPSSKSMFFKKLIQKYIGGSLDIFSPRPIIWCTALWGILHSWKSNPLWVWMYWGGRKRPLEILWKSGGSFDLANKPTKWCVGSVFICDGLRFGKWVHAPLWWKNTEYLLQAQSQIWFVDQQHQHVLGLVKNAESYVLPQTPQIRICTLSRSPGH